MRGLFDFEYQLEKINKQPPPLQKLEKVIDFSTKTEEKLKTIANRFYTIFETEPFE